MKYPIGSPEWTAKVTKAALDNRANQLNPNNFRYHNNVPVSKPAVSGNGTLIAAGAIIGLAAVGVTAYFMKKRYDKKKNTVKQEPLLLAAPPMDRDGEQQ